MPVQKAVDVIIAGGGIAGLTTALAAASHGASSLVITSSLPGAASALSAGMLAPSIGFGEHIEPLARAARDCYVPFLAGLRETSQIRVSLNRRGIVDLATNDAELEALHERARGENCERLDARSLSALEPALASHPGGLLYSDDGSVDCARLMSALYDAVSHSALIRLQTARVTACQFAPASVAVDTDDGARLNAAHLVIAAGAWAGAIDGLPRLLPVRPLHGQLMRLNVHPVAHVVHGGGGYLVPGDATLIVGATSESTGFDVATSREGLAHLRSVADRCINGLAGASMAAHWSALRPMSVDGLPILGPDPAVPHLFYAAGFSRNGILFAPWAAEQLASSMFGSQPSHPRQSASTVHRWIPAASATLSPFSISRFATE